MTGTWRRWVGRALLLGMVASLAACQTAWSRACLSEEGCERHPINVSR